MFVFDKSFLFTEPLSLLLCLLYFSCPMSVAELMGLVLKLQRKLQHSKSFRSFNGNESLSEDKFSSTSRVCWMASLSLDISWNGCGGFGTETHPTLIRGQSPAEMELPAVLALTSLTPQWCFLHCGTVAMQWAQSMLAALLSLRPPASPFPLWERGLSHWERGSVMCHLLFAEGGCCSYWAILSVSRSLRHNIDHTENEVWIPEMVKKQKWGREGRAQRKFSCSHLAEVIATFG